MKANANDFTIEDIGDEDAGYYVATLDTTGETLAEGRDRSAVARKAVERVHAISHEKGISPTTPQWENSVIAHLTRTTNEVGFNW